MEKVTFVFSDYSDYALNTDDLFRDCAGECPEENRPCTEDAVEIFRKLAEALPRDDDTPGESEAEWEIAEKMPFFSIVGKDKNRLRTHGKVGAICRQVDDTCVTVIVKTRFDKNPKKPYFLMYLLSQGQWESKDFDALSDDINLFELLLIYRFKCELAQAKKQGLFKAYRRFEYNDSKIKGPLDVSRHIRHNIPFNGNIAYNSKERTADNALNCLILHAYEGLRARFPAEVGVLLQNDAEFRKTIHELKEGVPGFYQSDVKKVIFKCLRPVAHPFYQNYELVRRTCLMILRHIGISVFDEATMQTQGVVFSVPGLWEKYLESMLTVKEFKTKVSVDIFAKTDSPTVDFKKNVQPDFCWPGVFVLDAKFKPKWIEAHNGNGLEGVFEDYKQVINYMVSFNALEGGVIFPADTEENETATVAQEFRISKLNETHRFHTFCVRVPNAGEDADYEPWCQAFKTSTEETMAAVKTCVKNAEERIREKTLPDKVAL